MLRIAHWPPSDCGNPYLPLYTTALQAHGVTPVFDLRIEDRSLREFARTLHAIHFHQYTEGIWRSRGRSLLRRSRGLFGFWKYLRLAKKLGLKVIWTVHDIEHHEGFSPLDRLGYRMLAKFADLVICHDQHTRKEYLLRYRGEAQRTIVMPIGNYDDAFPPPRPREATLQRFGLPNVKTLVGFGSIRQYKGFDLAIAAMRELGEGFQLIVAGQPIAPNVGDELRQKANGIKNVHLLLERIDDQLASDLLHAADCVVLPYRYISGSSALLSAFSLGRAVVATDLPFFRETLAAEPEAGVLVSPGDVAALVSGVRRFFAADVLGRHAAARRLADNYTWSEVVRPVAERLKIMFSTESRMLASNCSLRP